MLAMADSDRQSESRPGWPAAAIVLVGVLLFLVALDAPVMTNDEAGYVRKAAGSWAELRAALAGDNLPPLYFVYYKLWLGAAGIGEAALRLSSLPFVAAWLVLLAWWYHRLLPTAAARAALLVAAAHPFLLILHRQAKYFAAVDFLALAAVVLLWELLYRRTDWPRRRRHVLTIVWVVLSAALLWVHYIGAVVWAAMGGWLVLEAAWGRRRRAWRLLGALSAGFLLFVPHLVELAGKLLRTATTAVTHPQLPGLRRMVVQIVYTLYSGVVGHTVELAASLPALPGIAVAGLLVVWGGVILWRTGRVPGVGRRTLAPLFPVWFAVVMPAGGVALMWFFLAGLPDLNVPERIAFALPMAIAVGAAGWGALSPRWRWATAVPLGLAMGLALPGVYTQRANNAWDQMIPWPAITARIQIAAPGGGVLVSDSWHLGSRPWYYNRRIGLSLRELRPVAEAGGLEALADELATTPQPIFLLRAARDSSPGRHVAAFEELLTGRRGPPAERWHYVEDSPAMRRLKELVRRGTGTTTLAHKVEVVVWSALSVSPP
jgi:hypothetical protein